MLRILYAGSPEVAAQPLTLIIASGAHIVVGVLTNPPAAVGRSRQFVHTPVSQVASTAAKNTGTEIPVLTPKKLDAECREQISALKPDLLVCFAYGKIFGPKFLNLFPLGGINVHPSLLPLYRGAAPVPAAILNREKKTGITVQRICSRMDAGIILKQTEFALLGRETSGSVLEQVSGEAGGLVLEVLNAIESGTLTEREQDESLATYCTTLTKEDGRIDWTCASIDIDAKVRAYNPKPGAFTLVNGTVLHLHMTEPYIQKIETDQVVAKTASVGTVLGVDKQKGILIQTGNGIIAVSQLQWQAKKVMNWKDFMNGTRNFAGSVCV